jgi:hypothetical protein
MALSVRDIDIIRGNPPTLIGAERTTVMVIERGNAGPETLNESHIGSLESFATGNSVPLSSLGQGFGPFVLGKGDFLYAAPLPGGDYNGRVRVIVTD